MVLGTVELGSAYGINNKMGMPSYRQAYDVLEMAWKSGVIELDTAADYGESESIIGRYQTESGNKFLVDTKLTLSRDVELLKSRFDDSLRKLNSNEVNVLYLHSFDQCKYKDILDLLNKIKTNGLATHLGVSIYNPMEMEYILSNLPQIDTIQFPYNMFDNYRWEKDGLLERAVKGGKKLYVRSVFLQGLFFMESSEPFIRQLGIQSAVEKMRKITADAEMSIAELAFKFVCDKPEIESILIGCQTKEELENNVDLENKDIHLNKQIRQELEDLSRILPQNAIDPRKWRKERD